MKKKFIILVLVTLTIFCAHSQKTIPGYYFYNDARLEIPVSTTSALVYFNKTAISIDEIYGSYTIEKEVILDDRNAESMYAFVIGINSEEYEPTIAELKSKLYVYDVEPVIGEEGYTLVSNRFYVLLNDRSDTNILKTMAGQTMATYEGALSHDENGDLMWYVLSTNKSTYNALEMSILYGESGLFEDVDPGFIYTVRCNVPHPDDTMHTLQWSVYAEFPDFWADTVYGDNVNIAIIDDGVDVTHNEFIGLNTIASADFTGSTVTYPAAVHGSHATNVAGVIFANHNMHNIAGIAPHATLINISAINTNFSNPPQITQLCADIVPNIHSALLHAYSSSSDIVLCPWDFLVDSTIPTYSSLINNALISLLTSGRGGKGTIVIFASGNKNGRAKYIPYPANYDERIIVVGATDQNDNRYSLSCYGNELDVVAPGDGILTTSTDINGNHSIVSVSGTSVAAAHVAGLVALMLDENPNLTLEQVDWILKTSASKPSGYIFSYSSNHPVGTWNNELGYGEVSAHYARKMTKPNLVIKDDNNDNGTEPSGCSDPFDSPSIEVIDVSTGNPTNLVYPGGTFNVNVTIHNYSIGYYNINLSNVKLYYLTHLCGSSLSWNSSFSYLTPLTATSTTSNIINANGDSQTFVFQLTLSPYIPPSYMNNNINITFVAMVDFNPFDIHNYSASSYPLDDFIAVNRMVAGKTYLHYEGDPSLPFDPGGPKSAAIVISPNPTSGKATIEVTNIDYMPSNATIFVTDLYGNRVLTDQLNSSSYSLDLEGKPSGTYYIFVVANNRLLSMNNIVVY